ncbi:MAG: helix-turn-helix domain-containing protein [Pseudomonadota bacterium]
MPTLIHTPQSGSAAVGAQLRMLRRRARLSQLDLALHTGVSQRYLSCVETGRSRPSPAMLHALLCAMDTPLEERNATFLAAGYAPRYEALPLADPAMDSVRSAIEHLLRANNPAPAIALDGCWQMLAANTATGALFQLLGLPVSSGKGGFNLLRTLLEPGGLGDCLINAEDMRSVAWARANREALTYPALARLLATLPAPRGQEGLSPETTLSPLMLVHARSCVGELRFLSTFTTFGMPLDITVASLRIEHLIPADEATWQAMTAACAVA